MSNEKRLAVTLLVTLFILAGEIVGGYLSNSLALSSDAGHMVTDALAIALGLAAARISRKPSGKTRHYSGIFQRQRRFAIVHNLFTIHPYSCPIIYG